MVDHSLTLCPLASGIAWQQRKAPTRHSHALVMPGAPQCMAASVKRTTAIADLTPVREGPAPYTYLQQTADLPLRPHHTTAVVAAVGQECLPVRPASLFGREPACNKAVIAASESVLCSMVAALITEIMHGCMAGEA